jgi:pimeloyl-ACP methyl ester carboxylesterase
MSGLFYLGAALLVVAVAVFAIVQVLSRLLEETLVGTQQIYLDFSSQVELPSGRKDLERKDGPMLVFFHETAAAGNSCTKYTAFLAEHGVRVRAPDFPTPDLSRVSQGLAIFATEGQLEVGRQALRQGMADAGDLPLVLFGVSRGASMAALLAAEAEFQGKIHSLILDGFFSPRDTLEAMAQRFAPIYLGRFAPLLPRWFRRWNAGIALARIERRLGVKFPESLPALAHLKLPVLFLHGSRDRTAPFKYVAQYAAICPGESQVVVFPKTRHNQACVKHPERYREAIHGFLRDHGVLEDIQRPLEGLT